MANPSGGTSVWGMQNMIAAVMLVLGTLLVLAGVAVASGMISFNLGASATSK